MTRGFLLLVSAITLAGCVRSGKCKDVAVKLCNKCEDDLDDFDEANCKCIKKGKLEASDLDWFDNDEDAQEYCDIVLSELLYPGDYGESSCASDLYLMGKWDDEQTCEYWGFSDGDDDDDTGWR